MPTIARVLELNESLKNGEQAMAKWIVLAVGVILTGLGVLGVIAWASSVWIVIKACLALAALVIGLGIIVFSVGELRTPPEPPSTARKDDG